MLVSDQLSGLQKEQSYAIKTNLICPGGYSCEHLCATQKIISKILYIYLRYFYSNLVDGLYRGTKTSAPV